MGTIHHPQPVKLFVGMLAARPEWLAEAETLLVGQFGAVDVASDLIPFDQTDYYREAMGENLLRKFVAFEQLIRPDAIVETKHATNATETELVRRIADGPPRPVNLDPGYLELSKVVLATTKDYAHRICLARGIYAEVTLHYHHGRFEPWPWTYPDYRTEAYGKFFLAVRARLRENLRSSR